MRKLILILLLSLSVGSELSSQIRITFTLTNPRVENLYFCYDLNAAITAGEHWAVGSSNIRVNFTTTPPNGLTVKADSPAYNPYPGLQNALMNTSSIVNGTAISLNIITFGTGSYFTFFPGTYRVCTLRWNIIDSACFASMTFRVPPEQFSTVVFDSTNMLIYNNQWAVSNPGGIYISLQNITRKVPDEFFLFQNYPNPFNPSTKIIFDIPKSSFINLIIYDILGREVSVLYSGNLKPGTYEITWDASSTSSGVYFYKIIAQDFTDTKKMVLLK